MCGQHRSDVIELIKKKLVDNESILVASTQLVEAGVDLDFPVVYRAFTGLDGIAQAAGRCNREGRLPQAGRVHVFHPPEGSPPGHLRHREDTARELLEDPPRDEVLHPENFQAYFRKLLKRLRGKIDEKNIEGMKTALSFEDIAREFRIIEDTDIPVVVPYGEGKKYMEELRKGAPSRALLRKLQRYTVNVPEKKYEELEKAKSLEVEADMIAVLTNEDLYDDTLGFLMHKPADYHPPGSTVIG